MNFQRMGCDLSNSLGAQVRFTASGWDTALAVALYYGWEPAGIPKPQTWDEKEFGPWDGEYWINAGQEVTAEDAIALTVALDRAVAAQDFVERLIRIREEQSEKVAQHKPAWRDDRPVSLDQAESFRARLVAFARFTRQGPFIIE